MRDVGVGAPKRAVPGPGAEHSPLHDWRVLCSLRLLSGAPLTFPLDYRCPYLGPAAKDSHEKDLAASISVKPQHLVSDIPTIRAFFDVHALLVDAVVGLAEDAWVVSYFEQSLRCVFDPKMHLILCSR